MEYIRLTIDKEKGEITATSVDGYKVAKEYADAIQTDESFVCYIKPNIPKLTGIEYVEIELDGNRAYVVAGDNITGYRQPEGVFPDVDGVIKDAASKEPRAHIWINAQYLLDALQQIPPDRKSGRPLIQMDIIDPKSPVLIRHGKSNIKLVLPVNHSDYTED